MSAFSIGEGRKVLPLSLTQTPESIEPNTSRGKHWTLSLPFANNESRRVFFTHLKYTAFNTKGGSHRAEKHSTKILKTIIH